ncbi:MAG: chemotaxis protein CheW, partial [Eisenbergiella sp.]
DYSIRPVPLVPEYIKGIINLRGQIIPISDFRLRLGCMEDLESNSTIILQVESNTIGMMVDSVSQVLDIDLRQTSSIPVESRQELTNGMVSLPDGTVILLLNYEALVE